MILLHGMYEDNIKCDCENPISVNHKCHTNIDENIILFEFFNELYISEKVAVRIYSEKIFK